MEQCLMTRDELYRPSIDVSLLHQQKMAVIMHCVGGYTDMGQWDIRFATCLQLLYQLFMALCNFRVNLIGLVHV